jgi:hypothetical protein
MTDVVGVRLGFSALLAARDVDMPPVLTIPQTFAKV